jgi:hypothetical protein
VTRLQCSEVLVLTLNIGAFSVASLFSMRRIQNTFDELNRVADNRRLLVSRQPQASSRFVIASAAGRHLRLQILGTFAAVFITFLIRAIFSVLTAISYKNNDNFRVLFTCRPCDASCSSDSVPLFYFLQFTPQLQMSIMLVSSPLTLLVALWGMTSAMMWQCLRGKCSHNSAIGIPVAANSNRMPCKK